MAGAEGTKRHAKRLKEGRAWEFLSKKETLGWECAPERISQFYSLPLEFYF